MKLQFSICKPKSLDRTMYKKNRLQVSIWWELPTPSRNEIIISLLTSKKIYTHIVNLSLNITIIILYINKLLNLKLIIIIILTINFDINKQKKKYSTFKHTCQLNTI